MKINSASTQMYAHFSSAADENPSDVLKWQRNAIKEGLAAIKRGEYVDFENIKKYWEHRTSVIARSLRRSKPGHC